MYEIKHWKYMKYENRIAPLPYRAHERVACVHGRLLRKCQPAVGIGNLFAGVAKWQTHRT